MATSLSAVGTTLMIALSHISLEWILVMTRAVPARRMASTASDRSAGRGRFVAMMESVTAHKPTPSQKESRCRVVYSVPWPVGRAEGTNIPRACRGASGPFTLPQNREMPSRQNFRTLLIFPMPFSVRYDSSNGKTTLQRARLYLKGVHVLGQT